MEAAPRLPMICFELKISSEKVSFGPKLKQYIASFYHEDAEMYNNEIYKLESLRAAAMHSIGDLPSCQVLKEYYCQLHFLKSRFPMEEGQPCAVFFSWKDVNTKVKCSVPDIGFELMCVLYNIGALHSQLGAVGTRLTPDGMKMACTHFQCAAWAFHALKESYPQFIALHDSIEVVHAMELICLAEAQECILEKSMLDNRKATIIAKVAVQVVDYYKQALAILQTAREGCDISRNEKYALKNLAFKCEYHRCIALLYQGQQSEEQQKMGERVAFYQAALDCHEEARKIASNMSSGLAAPLKEALAFTMDVVEGKRKAAKNENEFIYHEEVPERDMLQEIKGASLVKGIPFNINDVEVSGTDIFARLVPMEAHEASSLYSEKKAQMLRQIAELVEGKDQNLAEFMSSLQLDVLSQIHQNRGLPQELIDRAAALAVRPSACQDLVDIMSKLSSSYHDVEAMLKDIQELLKEEERKEKEYQAVMGKRPPSIIATDLAREAAKYQEAHGKASESNQNLHRAMTAHVANIKILAMPLSQLQQQIPSLELPNPNVDEKILHDVEKLVGKVEEMKAQRTMLLGQLRDAMHQDDITGALVTRQPEQTIDQLFQQELEKHQKTASLIEQNVTAQDNILKALVDTYAQFSNSRKYLQDVVNKRNLMLTNLIASYDSYDDLLGKANKGIEFYNKLETNVSKLLQRIKSACKVQDEEREQILLKNNQLKTTAPEIIAPVPTTTTSRAPKLKDYLDSMKGDKDNKVPFQATMYQAIGNDNQQWPPAVRPAPVGSEINSDVSTSSRVEGRTDYGIGHMSYGTTTYGGQNYSYTYSSGYNHPISNTGQTQLPENQPSNANYTQPTGGGTYVSFTQEPPAPTTTNSYTYPSSYNQTSNYSNYNQAAVHDAAQPVSNQVGGAYTGPQMVQSNYMGYVNPNNQQVNYGGSTNPATNQMNYGTSSAQSTNQVNYDTSSNPSTNQANYGASAYMQPGTVDYSQSYPQSNYLQQPAAESAIAPNKDVDQVLSDRMAALLAKSGISGGYVPPQYSQFGYPGTPGYNQPASYSYVVPNLQSAPNYQTVSSTSYPYVTTSEQCAAEADNSIVVSSDTGQSAQGYPTGSYGYTSGYQAGQTASSTSIQSDHTKEYHTSQYHPSQTDLHSNTQATNQNNQQAEPGVAYQQYAQNLEGAQSSYYYNYPQQQQQSDTNATLNQNAQAESYYNYYGTAAAYPTPNSSTQQIPAAVNPTNSSTSVTSQNQFENAVKKESSIDLLAGLDFNISQAPLVPQQNSQTGQDKKEIPPSKPVETLQAPKISAKSEEKMTVDVPSITVKTEKPKADVFQQPETVKQFVLEVEKYEKFFDGLVAKTLNGPTTLDLKWKEVQDRQENENYNRSISIARCYPQKNRFPDILPFDYSRVELKTTRDDYINASVVKDASPNCPVFIVTQAPIPSTFSDFWAMVWEQDVEIIVCLLNNNELGNDIYWPREIGKDLTMTDKVVSLISTTTKDHWTERRISVSIPEKRKVKTLLHLQYTSWPGSLFPTSPVSFVNFTKETLTQYDQQNMSRPILVHCAAGVGRSGLFCTLLTAILEVMINPNALPDIPLIGGRMSCKRKNVLRDREHLKFAYTAFLHYLKELQIRYTKSESVSSGHSRKASTSSLNIPPVIEDPLSSLDPLWATKRNV